MFEMSGGHAVVEVAVVGGGPSGLMAAEALSRAGHRVEVFDAMPSLGRKFLLAGIGGLNITHAEDYASFCERYAERQPQMQAMLDAFTPETLRAWAHALGVDTFVGSSGRVFPKEMKAAPLLRAWLRRLKEHGVRTHVRHKWLGWNADGQLRFATPAGELAVQAKVCVLALGGASWPQLGSDGAWVPWLRNKGVQVADFESANCGFEIAWSDYLREKFSGSPVKSVALSLQDAEGKLVHRAGELVISQHGVEGSLIYAFSRQIRQVLNAQGKATFTLDLLPARSLEHIRSEVERARGGHSLPAHLKKRLGIEGIKLALLYEVLGKDGLSDANALATTLKALPLTVTATRPIAEAISSAGGLRFEGLDENLMVADLPGVFVAGEMLDWEAPTGGYLLTACFATGLAAGQGAKKWLAQIG
jgi:uncharacterized flavoprotein (TIGR03862 family)